MMKNPLKLPESRANEDVLAVRHGYACGLSEYVQWPGDAKATESLKRISANLFVPTCKVISIYRGNPDAAAKLNWHLSGGDIGQPFLLLDGITWTYAQVPSPELKAMIETMIARYHELDLVKISALPRAMLSATAGILRWYENIFGFSHPHGWGLAGILVTPTKFSYGEGQRGGEGTVNYSNEPNMQAAPLFNYAGRPRLSQCWNFGWGRNPIPTGAWRFRPSIQVHHPSRCGSLRNVRVAGNRMTGDMRISR